MQKAFFGGLADQALLLDLPAGPQESGDEPAPRPAVSAGHHVFPAGEVGEETDVLERSGNPLLHDLVGFTARDVLFDGVYACKSLSRFMELVSRPLLLLMP